MTDKEEENKKEYPLVFDRVKASVMDAFIMITLIMAITSIFSEFETVHTSIKIVSFVFIFVLYEPFSVSFFGGTIGHNMMRICVKKDSDTTKNISFLLAIIRFFAKFCLGWISFLTIHSNNKRMAIHDMLVKSVVVYKD